jgi:hypothetical protein
MKQRNTRVIPSIAVSMAVCLYFITIHGLSAQSASILESLQNKSQMSVSEDKSKTPVDIELLKSKPSRFAVGNIELYINARFSDLSMKDRATDPFGLNQDTSVKAVIRDTKPLNTAKQSHTASVPLSEIIKLIKVTSIMAKQKSFLSGSDIFKESDEFILPDQGKTRRMKVMSITESQILFQDMDTKEEAALKSEVLPFGMSSGDESFKPAGLVTPGGERIIDLERK